MLIKSFVAEMECRSAALISAKKETIQSQLGIKSYPMAASEMRTQSLACGNNFHPSPFSAPLSLSK
jgi:hypothetical protein